MYGSEDLNLPFPASTPYDKQGKEESDLFPHNEPINSGLLRYRSAPSTLLHDVGCEALAPNGSTSPEDDSMFAGFMSEKRPAAEQRPAHSSSFQMMLHSPQQQQQHRLSSAPAPAPAVKSLYQMMSSTAEEQAKSGGSSSILRRNTSPAGLFSQLNLDNGFNMLRATRDGYGHGAASNGESGEATARMMKGHQISFSPRQGSSGFMSQISEAGSNAVGGGVSSTKDGGGGGRLSNGDVSGAGRGYIPACYPLASWEDPVLLSDGLSGSKRARYPSDLHSGEPRSNHVSNLTHQPSLPTSSLDTPSSMEELRQLEGVVPCQIRAKRGCATHPRSIAERVRRTKISERMKKLQDLVPNMHKQTNTADMLDLAVDYVKDLQKTIQMLSDDRSKCTCTSRQKA